MDNIQDLLNVNILSLLNLDDEPEENKKKFIEKSGELLQKRIILNILQSFSDEDQKAKFIKAAQEEKDEEIDQLLENNNIELEDIAETEILQLKYDLIS